VRDRQAPAGAKDEFSRTHFTRCWPQSRLFSREPVTCPIEMRFTPLGAIVECNVGRSVLGVIPQPAPEKCSIRIRASLQRCRNRCNISRAFRRCWPQYHNSPSNALVDFPAKRDNSRLRQRNAHVTEVSPTRISRPRQRRRAAKTIHREARQKRNLWTACTADARHAYGFALRAMRHSADFDIRTHWKMSEVRFRTPLLPAVHVFRYFEPIRMYPAHPRANPAQGRAQSMFVLFHARPGRKGNLHAQFSPSYGCPNGIRESLQEVDRVARTLLSACGPRIFPRRD
jgi:hypothetical protein